jgi:hypothetical protein
MAMKIQVVVFWLVMPCSGMVGHPTTLNPPFSSSLMKLAAQSRFLRELWPVTDRGSISSRTFHVSSSGPQDNTKRSKRLRV